MEGKRNQARTNGSGDDVGGEGEEGVGEERYEEAFSRMMSRVSRREEGFGSDAVKCIVCALLSQVGCCTRTLTAGGSIGGMSW